MIRVGGSFVWPPRFYGEGQLKKVVFVAGGVGINPFMSMLSSIKEGARRGFKVEVLYSLRDPGTKRVVEEMLFVERIKEALQELESPPRSEESLKLFLTRGTEERGMLDVHGLGVNFEGRRMDESDLLNALGPVEERIGTVVYICGPPAMTDGLVRAAKKADGMDHRHVLCEKWW